MKAMYDSRADSIDAYLRAFAYAKRQAGLVFGIGPEATGLDLMDYSSTMRAMLPKLIRSYALDAVEAPHSAAVMPGDAAQFLSRIGGAELLIRPAVGIGNDVRLNGDGVSGAALWAEERYVHVCAFTALRTSRPGDFRTRISRPARRRAQ
jgi:hypothetical protein